MRGWSRESGIHPAAEVALALGVSAAFFLLAAAASPARHHLVLILLIAAVYVYVVFVAARRAGPLYAVPLAISGGLALDSFYIPPVREFGAADWQNWLVIALYISMGVLIGMLGARSQRRAEGSERARKVLAEEQAALRRVATRVAQGEQPDEVFAAVAEEVGVLLDVDGARVIRYLSGDEIMQLEGWTAPGHERLPVGPLELEGTSMSTEVLRTGAPARIDDFASINRVVPWFVQRLGIRSGAAAPIVVDGRLWGAMLIWSLQPRTLPAGAESRLAAFTELIATAVSNTAAHEELARLAEEQAALRRVATLVAEGAPPASVLAIVAEEVARVVDVRSVSITRYEGDGTATELASFSERGELNPVGRRWSLDGSNVLVEMLASGRPARINDHTGLDGEIARSVRARGIRSTVGIPIAVEGRLWGAMVVSSAELEPLPADTEAQLADFTELLATAIANAESRAELDASRARIVATADATRRQIERDLHDGAQQRLVSLALELRAAQAAVPAERHQPTADLSWAVEAVTNVVEELREIARGIHPAVLAEGGLRPALKTLSRRSAVPVKLDVRVATRLPERVEVTAYYVVSEALTNAAKHSHASIVHVAVEVSGRMLRVSVRDDGDGGADPAGGSGLLGLKDRVEANAGTLSLESPRDTGTSLHVELPLDDHDDDAGAVSSGHEVPLTVGR